LSDLNQFFSFRNAVNKLSSKDIKSSNNYLDTIDAFARLTYKSIYLIDYHVKGFEYVSNNPLFLCGLKADEVKEMGYEFYFKYVEKSDLDLLIKINKIGFEFYENIPFHKRKRYTISYDFKIENDEKKSILINQKLTPIFLTETGKIWKAICIISLSEEKKSGNIKVYNKNDNEIFKYDLESDIWRKIDPIKLSSREKEILQLAIRGYTIKEISESLFVVPDTIKFHRRKLFEKLEVSNITEAIVYCTNNNLI